MIVSMNITELIESFINAIKNKYPSLTIGFDFDNEIDQYDIWHVDSKLEFNNKDFKRFVAEKAREYLFNNNIYNFSFGYDHYKYKILDSSNKFHIEPQNNQLHLKISQNPLNIEETHAYSFDFSVDANVTRYIKIKEVNTQAKEGYENIFNSTPILESITYRDNEFQEAA